MSQPGAADSVSFYPDGEPVPTAIAARVALDAQRSLVRWAAGPGPRQMAELLASVVATDVDGEVAAATRIGDAIAAARLMIADADVCHVLAAAIPTMPDLALEPFDALDARGLMWFAQPMRFHLPTRPGLDSEMELRVAGLLWFPENVDGVAGLHLTPVIWRANDIPGITNQPGVTADGGVFRPFGTTSEDVAVRARGSAGPGELLIDLWLFLVGFWHLSRQEITESSDQEVPRKTAVNAARAGLRYPDGITVIGLRRHDREVGSGAGGSASAYRVRWAVRGHWRQHWYPSIKSNRPIYIHPYLKGPADAPLKDGSTVWVATGADLRDAEPEQVDAP